MKPSDSPTVRTFLPSPASSKACTRFRSETLTKTIWHARACCASADLPQDHSPVSQYHSLCRQIQAGGKRTGSQDANRDRVLRPFEGFGGPFDKSGEVEQERSFTRYSSAGSADRRASAPRPAGLSEFGAHDSCLRRLSSIFFCHTSIPKEDGSAPDHRKRVRRAGTERRKPYGLVQQVVRIQEQGESPRVSFFIQCFERS